MHNKTLDELITQTQDKANLATDPKIKTNLQNAVRAAIQRKEFFTEERNLYELEMAIDFIETKK